MVDNDSLKNVVKLVNSGKQYPALQLVKSSPETAAVISKLIKPPIANDFDLKKRESHYNLNQNQIKEISDSVKSRIKDNENITLLFPDIELAIQILVSSVLSPKDMVKTDIIYKAREAMLPSELTMKLNTVIQSHMEGHHKLKDELQTILRDTLFRTGSYVKAIIPEGIVDEIINSNQSVSTEALGELFRLDNKVQNLGILGNAGKAKVGTAMERFNNNTATLHYEARPSMESVTNTKHIMEHLEIVDNYKLLKMPKLIEATNRNRLKNIVRPKSVSLESHKFTNTDLSKILYKNHKNETDTLVVLPTSSNAKRKSIGRPLVLQLPSEAVIPVYVPGNECKHIGYFVLVDEDGNPTTVNSNQNHMNGLSNLTSMGGNNNGGSQSMSSMLLAKAKKNLSSTEETPTLDHITKVYSSIIENDLIERLSNGVYGKNVAIGDNEEIYRIMLARSLASKFTRLIFVPAELTTYFAFKYFPNGVGKSYLDDLKFLTSLRAIMLLSKVMALTKSAINNTHVNITLDPNDPDPQKTIEIAQHEIVRMRQQYFPIGINTPVDLVDWIHRAGLDMSFEGHPGLPNTKFDFEHRDIQHSVPDSDLDELLRKQTYMALGLSPEIVDNGFNAEFATTVVSNNILLSKRVMQLQETFARQLTDYAGKVILNDTIIMDELANILKDNEALVLKSLSDEEKAAHTENPAGFIADVIERFVDNLSLEFPKPDVTSFETQKEAFDAYAESLETTLTAWISSEVVASDIAGEISTNIDSIKAILKNYYLRRWMADNGYMVELNDIVSADEDGKPTLNIYDINKNHLTSLLRSSLMFIESMGPAKMAANTDLEKLGTEPGEAPASDDSGSGGDGGDDGGGDMGGGDMGGDMLDGFDMGDGGGEDEGTDAPVDGEEAPADADADADKEETPAP